MFVLSAIVALVVPAYVCGYKADPEEIAEVNENASFVAPLSVEENDSISIDSLFEKAVVIIKNYESLHKANNWPYVGYGHRVRKGDHIKKGSVLSEKEADKLLRKDLRECMERYKEYGKDAVLLAALAYNCGPGRVNHSPVLKKIKSGDRNIRKAYLAHSTAGGKFRKQLYERRTVEIESLYIP
jgi:GH24 family phage-related lysozyme (muramidase)